MVLETLPKTRSGFFLPRLALTALFLLLVAGIARFVWYPGLLLDLTGVTRQLLVIAAVALVVLSTNSTWGQGHGQAVSKLQRARTGLCS